MRRWPPERAATAAATSAPSLPKTTCRRFRDQGLAEGDGVVQVADALVEDAHRIPAMPWAMGVNTTGARFLTGARPSAQPGRAQIPATLERRQLSPC